MGGIRHKEVSSGPAMLPRGGGGREGELQAVGQSWGLDGMGERSGGMEEGGSVLLEDCYLAVLSIWAEGLGQWGVGLESKGHLSWGTSTTSCWAEIFGGEQVAVWLELWGLGLAGGCGGEAPGDPGDLTPLQMGCV